MPQWVDDCVDRYLKKGLSKPEAWKRCNGAYSKRKKSKVKRTRTGFGAKKK